MYQSQYIQETNIKWNIIDTTKHWNKQRCSIATQFLNDEAKNVLIFIILKRKNLQN